MATNTYSEGRDSGVGSVTKQRSRGIKSCELALSSPGPTKSRMHKRRRVEYLKAEKYLKPILTIPKTRSLCRRKTKGKVILLNTLLGRIKEFVAQFIEVKYTSVPYWRPWGDF